MDLVVLVSQRRPVESAFASNTVIPVEVVHTHLPARMVIEHPAFVKGATARMLPLNDG